MENIVYNELLIRGYNVDVGIVGVYAINHEERREFASNWKLILW